MKILLLIAIAYIVARVQHYITRSNMSAKWNGYGMTHDVLVKKALAPMNYRVLVPYLWHWTRNIIKDDLERYEFIRFVLLAYMLIAISMIVGFTGSVIFAVLLLLTVWFDYWDYAPEVAGLALCMTGDPWLAAIGIVLWGLSRETVLIAGPAFYLSTFNGYQSALILCLSVFVYFAVRKIQGPKPLYCTRWMWKKNIELITRPKRPYLFYAPYVTIGTCVLGLAGAIMSLQPVGLIIIPIIASGLIMAKIDETRVFAPVLIWATMLALKFLG